MKSLPIPSTEEFAVGGVAGVAQVLAGHPLDTIKTRLQLAPPNTYKGIGDCFVKTVQGEGFFGLFNGMGAPIVGVAFVNAVLFSAYGWFREIQLSPSQSSIQSLSLTQIALAGSGAGIVNSFVASPIELLKIRLQMQRQKKSTQGAYAGPVDVASRLIRNYGVFGGLFRGTTATILKEIPAYAGFYGGFEAAKRLFAGTPDRTPDSLPIWQLMISGSIGGMSYWTCCYPLDVIKAKIQRSDPSEMSSQIIPAFKRIYQESGYRGFFKGFGASLLRSIPSAAATFTVYELTLKLFRQYSSSS